MNDDEAARAARRAARATWPIVRCTLETMEDAQPTTPEGRLASMWQIARDGWAWRGEALPAYERSAIPGRIVRRGRSC
jgi:hypothetical protein